MPRFDDGTQQDSYIGGLRELTSEIRKPVGECGRKPQMPHSGDRQRQQSLQSQLCDRENETKGDTRIVHIMTSPESRLGGSTLGNNTGSVFSGIQQTSTPEST